MGLNKLIGWLFVLLFGFSLISHEFLQVSAQDDEGGVPQDSVEVTEEDDTQAQTTPTTETGMPGTEETEEVEEVVDESSVQSSTYVSTAVFFPQFPDRKFPVGSEITLLVGLSNNGEETYNITAMGAFLHSPYDLSYLIQNFTVKPLHVIVHPHQQTSIDYTFKPDKSLEPLEFWFSASLIYNSTDKNVTYRTVVYNDTIELVERQSDVNVRRVFTYLFALAFAGLIGFFAYNATQNKNRRGRKRTNVGESDANIVRVSGSAVNESVVAEWSTHVYKQAAKSKVVKPKKSNKKK